MNRPTNVSYALASGALRCHRLRPHKCRRMGRLEARKGLLDRVWTAYNQHGQDATAAGRALGLSPGHVRKVLAWGARPLSVTIPQPCAWQA